VAPADVWPAAVLLGDQLAVPATIMRGGTSRGVFFHAAHLPRSPDLRDRVILAVFGSPDARQIDGLGGATPLTSKVAIVARSAMPGADVDYVFGQVRIDEPRVDYAGNCGNMLSAVGPFAVDEGLVEPSVPVTTVRIHVVNTGQIVEALVPTTDHGARTAGSTAIAGVPGTGAPVVLDLAGLGATLGRGLLPTGNARESLEVGEAAIEVSIVDAGNPTVFVPAAAIGLAADRLFTEPLETNVRLIAQLEAIRGAAATRLCLVAHASRARADSPTIPKLYVVAPPVSYTSRTGTRIEASDTTLVTRGLSMGSPHPAIASTVAVCVATAARLPGTLVFDAATTTHASVRIGHPSGIVEVDSGVALSPSPTLVRARIERTVRRLMSGDAYVSAAVLER
jgi:2-methylaconitate cis-trans-isomerase PrpF